MQHFYNVTIIRLLNGIHVDVGCKSFVFNDIDEGMREIGGYLKDPHRAVARWKLMLPKDFANHNYDGSEMETPIRTDSPRRGYVEPRHDQSNRVGTPVGWIGPRETPYLEGTVGQT